MPGTQQAGIPRQEFAGSMTDDTRQTIGLLPLYLALYDDLLPDMRSEFDGFIGEIIVGFEKRGMAVEAVAPCCVSTEFKTAIRHFEDRGANCLVTLHLAYSPSLEAIDALCSTDLPVVMLDTTMDAAYGTDAAAGRLMFNHGIHGVMDLACMLRCREKAYRIVAGHYRDPSVLDRAAAMVRAVTEEEPSATKGDQFAATREAVCRPTPATSPLHGNRMLRIGDVFRGMGDFMVEPALLRERFGMEVEQIGLEVLDRAVERISDAAVTAEVELDRERFDCDLDEAVHRQSVRVGLGLRALLTAGGYHGFSINFQAFNRTDRAADTMPFLEISKAMARGIGYAGEGDVMTAALVGALAREFEAVTFTEIFCPDWIGNSLFLSHMGEISPTVAGDRPRICAKPAFDGKSATTAALTCAVKAGPAVFVNLAPGPQGRFSLIFAPVEVLAEDEHLDPAMRDTIRIWIRPPCPVPEFLTAYSYAGGTHHSALVLGEHMEAIASFGQKLGVDLYPIEGNSER
jgi:L-arabinose isomerase